MDLGSAIVISKDKENVKYMVQAATPDYCSIKFYNACGFTGAQKPLTKQELLEEDHY